jgi:hypothetical protein
MDWGWEWNPRPQQEHKKFAACRSLIGSNSPLQNLVLHLEEDDGIIVTDVLCKGFEPSFTPLLYFIILAWDMRGKIWYDNLYCILYLSTSKALYNSRITPALTSVDSRFNSAMILQFLCMMRFMLY